MKLLRWKPQLSLTFGGRKSSSDAVLLVEDEFNNLRAAYRAYDCVQSFLTPLYLQEFEEFSIQPGASLRPAEYVRCPKSVTDV